VLHDWLRAASSEGINILSEEHAANWDITSVILSYVGASGSVGARVIKVPFQSCTISAGLSKACHSRRMSECETANSLNGVFVALFRDALVENLTVQVVSYHQVYLIFNFMYLWIF
jgi:hypothetical protein